MPDGILDFLQRQLNREDPIPLYYQIEKCIRKMIEQGELHSGDNLPGDVELSAALGLNHATVRKAFSRLSNEGLIKRIRGTGTFVTEGVTRLSPCIGFFYFADSQAVMAERAEHMQRYLSGYGYDLKIVVFDEDYFVKVDLYEEIRKRGLQGAILVALDYPECKRALQELEKKNFPHVRLGNKFFCEELDAPLIKGNERDNIREVLEHLWRLGHRKIGLITCLKNWEIDEGYLEFYRRRKFEESWLMYLERLGREKYGEFPNQQLARGYLEMNPDMTAIVIEHPLFCTDVLKQAQSMGKSIPEEISLVCLTVWGGSSPVSPLITARRLPSRAKAEKACEVLLRVMNNTWKNEDKIIYVDYEWVKGETVAQPKRELEIAIKSNKVGQE